MLNLLDLLTFEDMNTYMCSRFCPCPDVRAKYDWIFLDLEDAKAMNRKGDSGSETPEPWVFGGLTFQVGSNVGFTEGTGGARIYEKEFSTFEECLKEAKTREVDMTIPNDVFISKALLYGDQLRYQMNVFDLVESNPQYQECSGACHRNLFYATLDVAKGIPKEGVTCEVKLIHSVSDAFDEIGRPSILCGLLLLTTFLYSYCLWGKYKN